MKKLILISLMLFSVVGAVAQTGSVVVTVKNIDINKGGVLSTGIFVEEDFPKIGKALISQNLEIESAEMKIVFYDVPAGTYGISSYQDSDKNNNLNTNFIGFPKEPVGFSNDARINLGPPSFADAAIEIHPDKTIEIEIILR